MSARALTVTVALLAWIAATPAAAYERTLARGTRKPLFWPATTITWHLNRSWPSAAPSCDPGAGGDPTLDAALASFAAWEQPCSELQLVYGGTLDEIRVGMIGSTENVVVFREGWCSEHAAARVHPCFDDPYVDCGNLFNCFEDSGVCASPPCPDRSVVALTSVLHDPVTGRIVDADIEVNGWDGRDGALTTTQPAGGWYFTCEPADAQPAACATYGAGGVVPCSYIDLRNTLTHEVGHLVGLAHVAEISNLPSPPPQATWATMEPSTDVRETWKRSLAADDVAGVCEVYPADGGCGCGSGGAGGALALLLGALALRRRRTGAG